jgi:hypothetical protein
MERLELRKKGRKKREERGKKPVELAVRGRKIGRIGGTWERTGRTGERREKNRSKGKEGVEKWKQEKKEWEF